MEKIVKREELAEVLGLSGVMINRLVSDGMPRVSHGKYDLAACVQWYIATWRKRAAGEGFKNIEEEKKSLIIAQTEKTKLETEKMRGEVLPMEDFVKVLNQVAVLTATGLDAVAARATPILVSIKGVEVTDRAERAIFKKLNDESRAIRESIAAAISSYSNALDGRKDNPPPTKPKRRAVGKRKKKATPRKSRARPVSK